MMILPPVTPVMPIDPTRVYELVSANTEAVKAVLFLLGFIAFAIVSSVLTVRYLAKAKTGLYSEIGGSIAMAVAVLVFIRYGASLVAEAQRTALKAEASKAPKRVKRLSMVLLVCFMLIYVVVIGQTLLSSLGGLFG